MTAQSALLTRLYSRLGITTASTAEEALCEEALNGAIAKVAAEGAPQLRQVYTGYSLVTSAPTVTHTAVTSTLTLSTVTGIYPGDIIHNTTTNKKYLIRTVTTSGATVNIGVPEVTSMTGNALTVYRRALPLPHAGLVWQVYQVDGNELPHDPLAAVKAQFETGTPVVFSQGYAATLGSSYISLYPAPTTATQYIIVQGPAFTQDEDVFMSEGLIHAVLSKAYEYRMLMSSQGGMAALAGELANSLEVLRTKTSAGNGIIKR